MDFTSRKIKPALVDQMLLNQYQKIKFPEPIQIIHLPSKETSELYKIIKKISSSVLSFIYNYFIILFILIAIIIYLWRRYRWYQKIKKNKDDYLSKQTLEKNDDEYLDSLYDTSNIVTYTNNNKETINYVEINEQKPDMISKKLEKNNSINSNMIKQAFNKQSNDTSQPNATGMSRENINDYINISTKMVKFADENKFDAYERNLINTKTGELLAYNEKSKYTTF